MTTTPPQQLIRCLAFITGRLAGAAREAEMRPSKVRQQRVRSLELLAAACVAEAARVADEGRPAPPPSLDLLAPEVRPAEELPESDVRGVWEAPPG